MMPDRDNKLGWLIETNMRNIWEISYKNSNKQLNRKYLN